MQIEEEQLEAIRCQAFIEGFVAACREFTSGVLAAVSLAHREYDRRKRLSRV